MRRWWWAPTARARPASSRRSTSSARCAPSVRTGSPGPWRPLRANRLSELVRFGIEQSTVTGRFTLAGAEREISVQIAAGIRQAYVDGKKAAKLEDYFGGVSVVAFTPDDLSVVKGGPEVRRAFLDRAVFNRFPAYLREHRAYQRALKSRNRLLKEHAAASYVEAYDEAGARTGSPATAPRRAP